MLITLVSFMRCYYAFNLCFLARTRNKIFFSPFNWLLVAVVVSIKLFIYSIFSFSLTNPHTEFTRSYTLKWKKKEDARLLLLFFVDPIVVIIVCHVFICAVYVIHYTHLWNIIIILSLMIIICHEWHTKWQLNFHRASLTPVYFSATHSRARTHTHLHSIFYAVCISMTIHFNHNAHLLTRGRNICL